MFFCILFTVSIVNSLLMQLRRRSKNSKILKQALSQNNMTLNYKNLKALLLYCKSANLYREQ